MNESPYLLLKDEYSSTPLRIDARMICTPIRRGVMQLRVQNDTRPESVWTPIHGPATKLVTADLAMSSMIAGENHDSVVVYSRCGEWPQILFSAPKPRKTRENSPGAPLRQTIHICA